MPYYKTDEVKQAVAGRWLEILDTVAPELQEAIDRAPRHVLCPIHGGKGDFRLFNDVAQTGGGGCNSPACIGMHRDGFALLQEITRKSFTEVRDEIGDLLGLTAYPTREERQQEGRQRYAEQKGKLAESPSPEPAPVDTRHAPSNAVGNEPGWKRDLPSFGPPPSARQTSSGASTAHAVEQAPTAEPSLQTPQAEQEDNVVPLRQEASQESILQRLQERDPARYQQIQDRKQKLERQQKRQSSRAEGKIESVWNGSIPLLSPGTEPARAYLKSRGLVIRWNNVLAQDSIRFHPNLEYWGEDENEDPELKGSYPAIICAIRDLDGNIKTLHRTYLTKSGKKLSRHGDARKMMSVPSSTNGGVTGSSIQLGEPVNGVLGVAEGLETAVSAYRGSHIPCWSAVNATLLEKIELPEDVHTVIIWADRDKSFTGQKVASTLAERLRAEGRKVHIMVPQMPVPTRAKGIDWNDVLIKQGILGFPRIAA